jgi:transcription elongation factor Elf1
MATEELDDENRDQRSSSNRHREFDCPSCNANNPVDPPFSDGSELLCNYCGSEFRVKINDEGRVRFLEV